MIYPENYRYSKSHEWVLFEEDGAARIGLRIMRRRHWGIWFL